ncbi:uroporphyrinogen-III synthase [Kaustia mangrovi]|uniref:Uroporphyrinogen-III synthase n=1 Tax=Kaustia mangrovi TaxID=2593653 RepID=A0A7S8C2N2_9HYPH|nr:uroporphyrinogen-III synthase [Kaustia mangrovi]QPC42243.1 uroporphyrinogen-III synthase [Kaustia mangrovi]
MELLVTRPRDDSEALREDLKARGHRVVLEPLLTICPRTGAVLPQGSFQAVIVTSANAVRALAAHGEADALRDTPMLTVGKASAEAALTAGFTDVESAAGDADALLTLVMQRLDPEGERVLYVTGSTVARDLKALMAERGFTVERAILYDARPAASLSEGLRERLAGGRIDGVLLFSPRTARIWAGLIRSAGLVGSLGAVRHFCLSQAVRDALDEEIGRADIISSVAEMPDMQAMMNLIGEFDRGRDG